MRHFILIIILKFSFCVVAQNTYFSWADSTVQVGQVHRDYSIQFKILDYDFLDESYPHLDSVYRFLLDHPYLKMEIRGNSDCRGNHAVSMRLNMARAKAIQDYLIQKGIAKERIRAMGFDDTRPLRLDQDLRLSANNKTMTVPGGTALTCKYIKRLPSKEFQESLHQLNRRFEFVITAI